MLNYTVTQRRKCRLCDSTHPTQFMKFDAVPFFDEIVKEETLGKEFSYPMRLFFCTSCSSVQTQHDINLHEYYSNYQYVASHSEFIRSYMRELVIYCFHRFGMRVDDKVIEVGAADGYLLSLFNQRGLRTLGFEAAPNLCTLAADNGVNVIPALFTKESLALIPVDFQPAQLLLLLHTFDHLYDPAPFLDTVRAILDPKRGVFLIEVHDFADIYAKREAALFGHEHASYLHYGSVKRLLERHGFRIIDFNFLPKSLCRGSSMLVAAGLEENELVSKPDLSRFENPHLDSFSSMTQFKVEVAKAFAGLRNYVDSGKRRGRRIAGYGAWGRGVTTLAMAGISNKQLEFVADKNVSLHGCYTPVSRIPIVGPESVSTALVDEVLVFNYAYLNEIRESLASFIECGGAVTSVMDVTSGAR